MQKFQWHSEYDSKKHLSYTGFIHLRLGLQEWNNMLDRGKKNPIPRLATTLFTAFHRAKVTWRLWFPVTYNFISYLLPTLIWSIKEDNSRFSYRRVIWTTYSSYCMQGQGTTSTAIFLRVLYKYLYRMHVAPGTSTILVAIEQGYLYLVPGTSACTRMIEISKLLLLVPSLQRILKVNSQFSICGTKTSYQRDVVR